MQTIAASLHKGGTGKTSLTVNVGYELSRLGLRVLLVDLDAQANLSMSFHVEPHDWERGTYDALLEPHRAEASVLSVREGLSLMPADMDLAAAALSLGDDAERYFRLDEALRHVQSADVAIVDCPPSLGFFTSNALYASQWVIVPFEPSTYAFRSLPPFFEIVRTVRRRNQALCLMGIAVTKYDRRPNSYAQGVTEQVREDYEGAVFESMIPLNVSVGRASLDGAPVGETEPDSIGAQAYRALAEEVFHCLEPQG